MNRPAARVPAKTEGEVRLDESDIDTSGAESVGVTDFAEDSSGGKEAGNGPGLPMPARRCNLRGTDKGSLRNMGRHRLKAVHRAAPLLHWDPRLRGPAAGSARLLRAINRRRGVGANSGAKALLRAAAAALRGILSPLRVKRPSD